MTPDAATDLDGPSGSQVARSGLWLFAPVAVVLFLALRDRILPAPSADTRSAPVTPDSLGELVPVTSFEGWIPRASDGARLLLRLEPLHPDPTRQAFDTRILAGRFGLEVGAASEDGPGPWRLTLIAEAGPEGPAVQLPAGTPPVSAAGEPERSPVGPSLDGSRPQGSPAKEPLVASLSSVEVSDLQPLHLTSQDRGTEAGADLRLLATLLGAASAPLQVGERADLIFWGARPEGPLIEVGGLGSVRALPTARKVRRRSEALAWEDGRVPAETEAGR